MAPFSEEDSDKENTPTNISNTQTDDRKELHPSFERKSLSKKIAAMRSFDDSSSDDEDRPGSFPQSGSSQRADHAYGSNPVAGEHKVFSGTERTSGVDDIGDSSDEEDGIGAYERIKKQLMGGSTAMAGLESSTHHQEIKSPIHQSSDRRSGAAASPSMSRRASRSPDRDVFVSRHSSPGLFVSPTKPQKEAAEDTEPEEDRGLTETRSRLQALVAQKRREREEKERTLRQQSDEEDNSVNGNHSFARAPRRKVTGAISGSESDRPSSSHGNKKARPARKAGKRAIEEMNRETQRISRNMQLTHQAKTRTKFTTADLFKKMGFRQPAPAEPTSAGGIMPNGSSSPAKPNSDGELNHHPGTPPSSPPSLGGDQAKEGSPTLPELYNAKTEPLKEHGDSEELPSFNDLVSQMPKKATYTSRTEQQRGHADSDIESGKLQKPSFKKFLKSAKRPQSSYLDDDDLEIVKPAKPSRIAALDQVPARQASEPHSIQALRVLAHLNDHNHQKRLNGGLTASELKVSLARRAREQAQLEKLEKIQALKDKGIYVETEEEKERNQMQIESMIERARREADELAKREKETAKREGKNSGNDVLDSDEDEDFAPSEEDDDVELSGSEDEDLQEAGNSEDSEADDEGAQADDEDEDMEQSDQLGEHANPMVDDAAEEASNADEEIVESENEQVNNDIQTPQPKTRRRKAIVADDSEDEANPVTPAPPTTKTPGSKASLAQAFGFAQDKSPAGDLSQFFGGTMAQSQSQTQHKDRAVDSQEDSLAFLRGLPSAPLPEFVDTLDEPTQECVVQDSQTAQQSPAKTSPAMSRFDFQSPHAFSGTEASQFLEATQDFGFKQNYSPARGRDTQTHISSIATIDTVMLAQSESPIPTRRGRLHRGRRASAVEVEASDQETGSAQSEDEDENEIQDNPANAFSVMENASKNSHQQATFDKRASNAKAMFEEQAEESEDEYAGLGGASDSGSDDEMNEEDRKWMNENNVKVNRGKAAEFHAEWERTRDEKDTTKLYRDITTGALRRQRDNGGDLLDWDDEDEAHARRRAARQRQEAKMRKALLSDGNLEKIAENPKQQAFFQAVADYAGDDEVTFLDEDGDEASQSRMGVGDSSAKRKRDNDTRDYDQAIQDKENMPPPRRKARRTNHPRPQTTLSIKRALSSLIDDPDEQAATDTIHNSQPDDLRGAYTSAMDSDENDSDTSLEIDEPPATDNTPPSPPHHERTNPDAAKRNVIDRMALKRTSSASDVPTGRLAFQTTASNGSFKPPSLLRRATTNASVSTDGSLAEKSAAAGLTPHSNRDGVKMGGSKKSSVNFHIRDARRREKLERLERERTTERYRVGRVFAGIGRSGSGSRSGLGGLGGGGGGGFE